jgi:hypothetical protein
VRRLLILALAGLVAYTLFRRRRGETQVTIGFTDGSSVALGKHDPGVELIVDAARDVLGA